MQANFPWNLAALVGWLGYIIFFYVEGSTKILHFSIKYGFRKTASYNPEPISTSKKIQFMVGANLIFCFHPTPVRGNVDFNGDDLCKRGSMVPGLAIQDLHEMREILTCVKPVLA
ncbi:hypothetical protein GF325_15485 [Candidatus Bathyarchaeota archaeon]|nr:hypothetical protein [Candidatus Bathyarchaeota archaeon]